MPYALAAALLLCACAGHPPPVRCPTQATGTSAERTPTSTADPTFLAELAATRSFRLGRPHTFAIAPDDRTVLFLRSGPRSAVQSLWEHDALTGEEREIVTTDQLLAGGVESLSSEERARRERLRMSAGGITAYELSKDGRWVLVPLSGRLFVYDRGLRRSRELPIGDRYANEARLSPDASRVAFVAGGDLFVLEMERSTLRQLTRTGNPMITNGLAEFIAQEELDRFEGYWWSPDSETLLFEESDTTRVERVHLLDPMNPSAQPETVPYPRPGQPNARVRLALISARGNGRPRWIEWDNERYPYLARVVWDPEVPPTLVVLTREQQNLEVLALDPDTGRTRLLVHEHDAAWLNVDSTAPRWVDATQFLWSTERNGTWQLELWSASGSIIRTLTPPDIGYRELLDVDTERGLAWFAGGPEPTEQQVYRVTLGGEVRPLTQGRAYHSGSFGLGRDLWVRSSSSLTEPPETSLMRDTRRVGGLRSVAATPVAMPSVELLTVGERNLRTAVLRPSHFEPDLRYPVLLSVYGGPHTTTVQTSAYLYLADQWHADRGYIVVRADGRGTPYRGREWERAIRGNLIDVPLADQIDALHALAQRVPQMDLSRVGVFGWSFGGYLAAVAVLKRPDVFAAAAAGAPVTEWADYDSCYTERYLGMPDADEAGYRASSAVALASRLTRPLLLLHGTADDNVHFSHSLKLSNALLRAGRTHEFLPLSGFTHMVSESTTATQLRTRIGEFFDRNLTQRSN